MSAYRDWISKMPLSSNMLIDEHRTLVHQAFEAGLEAAAVECEGLDNRTMASLIRALKED